MAGRIPLVRRGARRLWAASIATLLAGACSASTDGRAESPEPPLASTRSTAIPASTTTPGTTPGTTAAEPSRPAPPTDPALLVVEPTRVAELIAERPAEVVVPADLDPATPAPLVVVLHGYTASGAIQSEYFGFRVEAARRGMVLVHPDGTVDPRGDRFWNATDACCNFFGADVDDVEYLSAVVQHVAQIHPIDPDRIFLAGHSNGGFMSYRFACERADLVAAVVSLAGAMPVDASSCTPSEPVSVVQVHGTLDTVIGYDGGEFLGRIHPSSATSVDDWRVRNGCKGDLAPTDRRLDLDAAVDGAETRIEAVGGCPAGGSVERWTIEDGSHVPELSPAFATAVFDAFESVRADR